jgi:CheY-specific phosphatase CheX
MSIRLGTQISIIASLPAAAREILKIHDKILSGRYLTHATPIINPSLNNFSIAFSNECNDHWKCLRAICKAEIFSTKALESQKNSREKKVMELVGFLGSKEGEVVNLADVVCVTATNMLSNTLFSMDFLDFEGQGIGKWLRKLISEQAELGTNVNLSALYPILSGCDLQGIQKKRKEIVSKFITIWEDIIKERREQDSAILDQRDFLDALIKDGCTDDQINQLIVVCLLSLSLSLSLSLHN